MLPHWVPYQMMIVVTQATATGVGGGMQSSQISIPLRTALSTLVVLQGGQAWMAHGTVDPEVLAEDWVPEIAVPDHQTVLGGGGLSVPVDDLSVLEGGQLVPLGGDHRIGEGIPLLVGDLPALVESVDHPAPKLGKAAALWTRKIALQLNPRINRRALQIALS